MQNQVSVTDASFLNAVSFQYPRAKSRRPLLDVLESSTLKLLIILAFGLVRYAVLVG